MATIIYISHLTRDNIDIEVFFKQISTLSEVYIQDQNLSEAFMQFNVNGTPTITVNNKVAIPVLIRSAGVGITGFPDGHQVLLSFFTNTLETDQRLSLVESKTSNIASVSAGVNTNFTGTITASGFNTTSGLIQRAGKIFTTNYGTNTQGGTTGTFNLLGTGDTLLYGSRTIPINSIQSGDTLNIRISGKLTLPSGSQAGIIFSIGALNHTCFFSTNPQINSGNFEIISRWNCNSATGTVALFNITCIGSLGLTGQNTSSSVFGSTAIAQQLDPTVTNLVGVSFYNPTYNTCSLISYNISMFRE